MQKTIIDQFRLNDKTAIITGTTKGVGQSLAEALLEAGADVIGFDRSDNSHLKLFSSKTSGKFKRYHIDFLDSDKTDIQNLITTACDQEKNIDILINNAGISYKGSIDNFNDKNWHDVIRLNLDIPFYLSKYISTLFINQKHGKIINVASMMSFRAGMDATSYTSSKHGIAGLTKSMADSLGKYGIQVNAIAPGYMALGMTKLILDNKEICDKIVGKIPSGRFGTGDDLKGIIIFLCSSLSDYINGAIIPIDGGYLVR